MSAVEVRTADVSDDGRYRYSLTRSWGPGPLMLWVLANPSTADASVDDPTVRRCAGFARREGCGGLRIVNLWAWRAADPRLLRRVADPVGAENDDRIVAAVAGTTGPVVLGWGTAAAPARVGRVLELLRGRPTLCLGTTRAGHPRHPLYVAGTTGFRPW